MASSRHNSPPANRAEAFTRQLRVIFQTWSACINFSTLRRPPVRLSGIASLSFALNHFLFLSSCLAIGAVSGFLGGLLGIGGGVVIVPALIIVFDLTGLIGSESATVVAVATSLSCIVLTSLSAAITQARAGMVDWEIVRRWVFFLVLGSFVAGSLADNLPSALFRTLIGGFLLFVAFVMLTSWKPSATATTPT